MEFSTLVELSVLNQDLSFLENIEDPDQQASDEAIWSGSTLSSTDWKYVQ